MIVITGASGQLGSAVATALGARIGAGDLLLGSRSPEKLADFAARGFATTRIDFDDAEAMCVAFDGAEVVLMVSADADDHETRVAQHRRAVDAARSAGVGRLVYTSFANAVPQSLFPFAAAHAATEQYLIASGIDYTIVRNQLYADNVSRALARARETGVLALPSARGRIAYIAHAELGAAIAGALVGDGHSRKTYELTGPRAVNLFDIAAMASPLWAREVRAEAVSEGEFAKGFRANGVPDPIIEAVLGLWRACEAGEYDFVTDDAPRLAGRPIEDMRGYLARTAA